jgi:hypothetical protein
VEQKTAAVTAGTRRDKEKEKEEAVRAAVRERAMNIARMMK